LHLPTVALAIGYQMADVDHIRVREAQAAGIVRFVHIDGKENPADILTKPRSS
jgi:hypothetical protein